MQLPNLLNIFTQADNQEHETAPINWEHFYKAHEVFEKSGAYSKLETVGEVVNLCDQLNAVLGDDTAFTSSKRDYGLLSTENGENPELKAALELQMAYHARSILSNLHGRKALGDENIEALDETLKSKAKVSPETCVFLKDDQNKEALRERFPNAGFENWLIKAELDASSVNETIVELEEVKPLDASPNS